MTSNNEQRYFVPAAPGFSVVDCDHRPEAVTLSASTRAEMSRVLEHEEMTTMATALERVSDELRQIAIAMANEP
jgi:hypothetical protein